MFDIFKGLADGNFSWVDAVKGLPEAKRHIHRLALREPGSYLIHSQQLGFVLEHVGGSDNHLAI